MYEGHCFDQLGFATRVMAALGAQRLIVSNAAGGLNPQFVSGDVMLIDDHINFMNALRHSSSPRMQIRQTAGSHYS